MSTPLKKPNPFPYSDSNKRYHTYDYAMRKRYGGKCSKIILDAGFSCPNIDGTKGRGGCLYCSQSGSGDFTQGHLSLEDQFAYQKSVMERKWQVTGWIPYLQAHTNTYAPISRLKDVYSRVLAFEGCVGMSIDTRCDCLPDEVLELLAWVSSQTDLTVELGLQSIHDKTAKAINRCHTYEDFTRGVANLHKYVPKCRIGVHLINGLPGESLADMVESARAVGALGVHEIKLHLLYVVKGTRLATLWEEGKYLPMTQEAYVESVVKQLEYIPQKTVIGRITGDAPGDTLLAPLWSRKKLNVMNCIDQRMVKEDTYQGKYCDE